MILKFLKPSLIETVSLVRIVFSDSTFILTKPTVFRAWFNKTRIPEMNVNEHRHIANSYIVKKIL